MKPFITQPVTIRLPGDELTLHAEAAGTDSPGAPLVLLLHGFPEFWYGWRAQIGALAQSGFRVVALDQRGYNLSGKPRRVEDYRLGGLARDAAAVIEHFGRERALVVGHDWGAAVAWRLAIEHPQRVEKLAILNVPHPGALQRAIRERLWQQMLRSWYVYFFQIPGLPEWLLRAGGYAGLKNLLRASARPGTFSAEDLRRYQEAWAQPGALTAMLNWYRAAARFGLRKGREEATGGVASQRVTLPVLILWGEKDIALHPLLAQWSLDWCDQGRLVRFPNASHWVQHEEAERVNARLLEFFQEQMD
jgi:pimeloyl-ACP methyl ester carboxylesterase